MAKGGETSNLFNSFTPKIGEDSEKWLIFFRWGWNHQLETLGESWGKCHGIIYKGSPFSPQ